MGKKQKEKMKPSDELADWILREIRGYGIGTVLGIILAIIIMILVNKGIIE